MKVKFHSQLLLNKVPESGSLKEWQRIVFKNFPHTPVLTFETAFFVEQTRCGAVLAIWYYDSTLDTVPFFSQMVSERKKYSLIFVTFHAKTYTNGFPLKVWDKGLLNCLWMVYQAIWNGFIERKLFWLIHWWRLKTRLWDSCCFDPLHKNAV